MALNDRDILITPNKGTSTEATIAFIGANTLTSATITLHVYNSSTIGQLSFEGASGQLFSIVDSLVGTIFSVNDISGIPSIEVLDTGQIKLAQYNGYVSILGTTSATSTLSGVLQVAGGVGIGGALYIGTNSYVNNSLIITSGTISTYAVTGISAGTDTAVSSTGSGQITIWDTSTLQSVTSRGSSTTQAIKITNTTISTSTNTGALQVVGGVGIGGALWIGSTATVANSTSATSTNTGALQVYGGVGIGGALYVGTTSYIAGSQILTAATIGSFGVTTLTAGTDTAVSSSTGNVTVWNTSTLQTITSRGSSTNQVISITNTSSSISTTTGALVVTGGVGIGGSVWVGNGLTVTNNIYALSTLTTMAGYGPAVPGGILSSNGLIWNSASGSRSMNAYMQVNGYQNNTASPISKLSFFVGSDNNIASEQMYVTSQGLFYIAGGATFAGSTLNDLTNSLRIQNTATSTNGTSQPSNKLFLQGTSWNSAQGSVQTNGSIQAITLNTNANPTTEALVFAPGSGVSGVTATNYFAMTNQARFGIGTTIPNGLLDVVNTTTNLSLFSVTTTTVNISITTSATSTNTGALQVVGGVGIGGNVWVGGYVTATNFYGTFNGTINATNLGSITVGYATTATNLAGGAANQIPYQSNTGTTVFSSTLTFDGSILTLKTTTTAANTQTAALVVAGGIAASNLWVGSPQSTQVSTFNGPVTFGNTVLFSGTATYSLSSNTYFTDNLLELHLPPPYAGTNWTGAGGVGSQWLVDDLKDIGLRFHYYSNTDTNAALVLANDTKYLEWYQTGIENTQGVFTGTFTYGTFKTGIIYSVNTTNAITYPTSGNIITANAGAIQTLGGLGVAKDIWVGGNVTATNFYGIFNGTVNATNLGSITVGYATTATNLAGGATNQIPFQTGVGLTGFSSNFTFNSTTQILSVTSATITGSTSATSTTTGALVVTGGVGIGGNAYVGGRVGFVNTSNVSVVYQYYNPATGSLDTVFG